MKIKWQDVITSIVTTVGGGAVLLAAAAWLTRELVTHKLAQDVEVFKTRLQTEANTEIEKLKASLQLITLEHQVRFPKLHEKRAEVIAEMYRLLVDLHEKVERFRSGWGPRTKEAYGGGSEPFQLRSAKSALPTGIRLRFGGEPWEGDEYGSLQA